MKIKISCLIISLIVFKQVWFFGSHMQKRLTVKDKMLFCKSEDVWLQNTKVNSKQITLVVFMGNILTGSLFFFLYIVDVKILLDISLARRSWYWIGTKLQFGVYNQCKPFASPSKAKNGECFFRGEKGVRRVAVNRIHGFSGTETVQGKESFFLLGSAFVTGCRSSPFWSPEPI